MKAIVFGASGFIGSHVVVALMKANHNVTAIIRESSQSAFLESLGVPIKRVNYSDLTQLNKVMEGQSVVYNCTASKKLTSKVEDQAVEVSITKKLIQAALNTGISHFIQLSSIIIYGFEKTGFINETYQPIIETPIQIIQQKRERIVIAAGQASKMAITVVRPASTIGERGVHSFFAKLFFLNQVGKFPIINSGQAMTSFIDTRDLGRTMTIIAEQRITGLYLLKGFDTTWIQLKDTIDTISGQATPYKHISTKLANQDVSSYEVKVFSTTRIWNDTKIRNQGVYPKYSLDQAVKKEIDYLKSIE